MIFQAIREKFLEIDYLLDAQKTYICSFHSSVYKASTILCPPIPTLQYLEEKIVGVIIPRVNNPKIPEQSSQLNVTLNLLD